MRKATFRPKCNKRKATLAVVRLAESLETMSRVKKSSLLRGKNHLARAKAERD